MKLNQIMLLILQILNKEAFTDICQKHDFHLNKNGLSIPIAAIDKEGFHFIQH